MKKSYFPYLPNSRIEDNKRYKYIRDMMEKNPFTYHKRKIFLHLLIQIIIILFSIIQVKIK